MDILTCDCGFLGLHRSGFWDFYLETILLDMVLLLALGQSISGFVPTN